MPQKKKVPDVEVLKKHREDGWKLREIAEHYDVSIAAIQNHLRKAGATHAPPTYKDVVPWKVHPSLSGVSVSMHLRAIAKQAHGIPLDPAEERSLSKWLDLLMDNQVVLDYHDQALGWPNDACSKGGFFYRTAVPEDKGPNGGGFYREPWINEMLAKRQKEAAEQSNGAGTRRG